MYGGHKIRSFFRCRKGRGEEVGGCRQNSTRLRPDCHPTAIGSPPDCHYCHHPTGITAAPDCEKHRSQRPQNYYLNANKINAEGNGNIFLVKK